MQRPRSGSCARVLNFPAHHFSRCRHFAKISDLLFRSFVGSALIMHNFSSMQRLHRFPPDVYAGARFKIDQDMENFWWFFFNFHINLDSSVSFSYLIRLNDFLWLLYLSLNRFAVIPMYSLISPSDDFTSALYTMELDRQLLLSRSIQRRWSCYCKREKRTACRHHQKEASQRFPTNWIKDNSASQPPNSQLSGHHPKPQKRQIRSLQKT